MGIKLPQWVPGFDGITFADLAEGCNAVYQGGSPKRMWDRWERVYGPSRILVLPPGGPAGIRVTTIWPNRLGPVLALLSGQESVANWVSLAWNNAWAKDESKPSYPPVASLANHVAGWIRNLGGPQRTVPGWLLAGHSMGAAVATMVGDWWRDIVGGSERRVVSFGSPKIWRNVNVDRHGGAWLWRFVNYGDIVPMYPNRLSQTLQFTGLEGLLQGELPRDWTQTPDGILLDGQKPRWGLRNETPTLVTQTGLLLPNLGSLVANARIAHLPMEYARSLSLCSDGPQPFDGRVSPELLAKADIDDAFGEPFVGGGEFWVDPDKGQDTPRAMRPPTDFTSRLNSSSQAAIAAGIGPGQWAVRGAARVLWPVGALPQGAKEKMIVSIPKQYRWSYSRLNGQYWASWMGQQLIQAPTSGQARNIVRKQNAALRQLQQSRAVNIEQYGDALAQYLGLAAQGGTGFVPTMVPAS